MMNHEIHIFAFSIISRLREWQKFLKSLLMKDKDSFILLIPWLLMWWCQKIWHQYLGQWPSSHGIVLPHSSYIHALVPILLTNFPSHFKCDGNFILLSSTFLIWWSLQNIAHGTTAVLSWHVQHFVAIWITAAELRLNEISIEFELWWKNR